MWSDLFVSLFVLYHVGVARAGYPTMGDEVQAGSVLLPASRRGRYLANIVRRQAVDGTGIKFNKDADRMNAEARKKVDVLSEELLPYIIAEQERRVTLYRRVMTAVQNGENGVTVAEIRNKPPVIIRKGLLYRCPTNRAPVEPDGSGAIRCEDNIDPSPIMFDSCLSAEDRELYVAENKFFFCNRHRQEGADLPRNGTAVIGCAPAERTSLNYTSQRCALEDTDDVVVHYRYYPDKTYKFVSELDPEREVCDHWSPCQLGYIFSLPGPDQAAPAIELWHDYDDTDVAAIVADEIVPAVPEDTLDETAILGDKYVTSTRKVEIPEGYSFHGLGFHSFDSNSKKTRLSVLDKVEGRNHLTINYKIVGNVVYITMTFDPLQESDCGLYYARFQNNNKPGSYNSRDLINIVAGQRRLVPLQLAVLPGQRVNATRLGFACERCALRRVVLRALDGVIRNVDEHKYATRRVLDEQGEEQSVIELDMKVVNPRDMGDYFLLLQNEEGDDETIKALTIIPHEDISAVPDMSVSPLLASGTPHELFHRSMEYSCPGGQLTDVLCHGASVADPGRVIVKPNSVEFHFADFEDIDACVYMGVFRVGDNTYRKELAVIDNDSPDIQIESDAPPEPVEGEPFSHVLRFSCRDNCTLTQVSVNGIPLEPLPRRAVSGSIGYYLLLEKSEVKIGVTEYSPLFAGHYQGVFKTKREHITKNLMKIEAPASARRAASVAEDGDLADADIEEAENRRSHSPSKSEADSRVEADFAANSLKLRAAREALAVRRPYERSISYEGAQLLAVRCRGRDVGAAVQLRDREVKIGFDQFQDTDACVYTGLFKVGDTTLNRTIAVIENNSPIMSVASATVAPPAALELKHELTYTCNVAKSCKPVEVYINDKVLKSNDINSGFSVKSKEKMLSNGKEVTVYTLHFAIRPFSKEYEGVYQLVVSHGKERITKNIMEVA